MGRVKTGMCIMTGALEMFHVKHVRALIRAVGNSRKDAAATAGKMKGGQGALSPGGSEKRDKRGISIGKKTGKNGTRMFHVKQRGSGLDLFAEGQGRAKLARLSRGGTVGMFHVKQSKETDRGPETTETVETAEESVKRKYAPSVPEGFDRSKESELFLRRGRR